MDRLSLFQHYDKHSQAEIESALTLLQELNPDFDPNAEEFEDSVIELLDQAIDLQSSTPSLNGIDKKAQLPPSVISRQELYEHFQGAFTSQQIDDALIQLELADAQEFEPDILSNLDELFTTIQSALDDQKLTGSSITQLEEFAVQVAGDRLKEIPIENFKALIQIVAGRVVATATFVHEFQEKLMQQVEAELNKQSLQERNQRSLAQIMQMREIAQNQQSSILDDYGLTSPTETIEQWQHFTTGKTTGFDPEMFSQEVEVTQKKLIPTTATIKDTQNLAKSLLRAYLSKT